MKPTQEQALDWAFECDFVESNPAEDVFSAIYVCCPKDIERLVILAYEAGRKDAMSLPKVSPYEFLKAVKGKENMVGIPIFWSKWPTAQGENND